MDFVMGLPRTSARYDAIWVIVDRLTKSTHFLPVRANYPFGKISSAIYSGDSEVTRDSFDYYL